MANAEVRDPAASGVTPRSAAMSGTSPASMNSEVASAVTAQARTTSSTVELRG